MYKHQRCCAIITWNVKNSRVINDDTKIEGAIERDEQESSDVSRDRTADKQVLFIFSFL